MRMKRRHLCLNLNYKMHFSPEQQNMKLNASSQICQRDCRKPPSTLRNQILHLTLRAAQGEVGIMLRFDFKLAHTKHLR